MKIATGLVSLAIAMAITVPADAKTRKHIRSGSDAYARATLVQMPNSIGSPTGRRGEREMYSYSQRRYLGWDPDPHVRLQLVKDSAQHDY